MKQKRKAINWFVIISVIMLIGIVIITMKKTKNEIVTTSKETKKATTSATFSAETDNSGNSSEMTWDISENGDGSVIATLTEDGTLTITGQGRMKDSSYNDWDGKCRKIVTVIINEGITNVTRSLLRNCEHLKSITIPATVSDIAAGTFDIHSELEEINVDRNNEKFISEDGILFNKEKTKLIRYLARKTDIEYEIPTGVTVLEEYAFAWCNNLTNITIPEGVTTIGMYTFEYCRKLTNITIPASVTYISYGPFLDCTSLTEINVDSNNEKFIGEDGILFSKDKTKLISYPTGKTDAEYKIPSTVTEIETTAFYKCTELKNVTIPEGITTIRRVYFCLQYKINKYNNSRRSNNNK